MRTVHSRVSVALASVVCVASLALAEQVALARTTGAPLDGPVTGVTAAQTVSAPQVAAPTVAARIRVCHISRHPRDGVPASEHACPLIVADLDVSVSASID
jgi:hypothetical protein